MDSWLDDFRKESSEKGVWITPTNVESRGALRIDDYRKKQIKEAEPFPPLFFQTVICFTPNRLST
jgi:hypothetical protein